MFVLEPFLQLYSFIFFFQLSIWYRKAGTSKGDCVIVPLVKDSVPFSENEGHVRMFLHYKMNYLAMCITCSSILDSNLVLFLHYSCQEHFFDGPSHSGFIEMRLRNIRRKLQQSQRMYSLKRHHCTQNLLCQVQMKLCQVSG